MNELENKLKNIAELTKSFNFGKNEVVKLVKNLLSEYKISFADLYPDMAKHFDKARDLSDQLQKETDMLSEKIIKRSESSDVKGTPLELKVIYEGNVCSKQVVAGRTPIGVVIEDSLLLYWQESGEDFTRRQADEYIRRLPSGYSWHLMSLNEALRIRNMMFRVNETLRCIGGDPIGYHDYMLADDDKKKGRIRYCARI